MQKMIEMLKPNLNTIVSLINQYKLTAKFCVVIESSERPIIFLSSDILKTMAQLSSEIEFDMYLELDKDN